MSGPEPSMMHRCYPIFQSWLLVDVCVVVTTPLLSRQNICKTRDMSTRDFPISSSGRWLNVGSLLPLGLTVEPFQKTWRKILSKKQQVVGTCFFLLWITCKKNTWFHHMFNNISCSFMFTYDWQYHMFTTCCSNNSRCNPDCRDRLTRTVLWRLMTPSDWSRSWPLGQVS